MRGRAAEAGQVGNKDRKPKDSGSRDLSMGGQAPPPVLADTGASSDPTLRDQSDGGHQDLPSMEQVISKLSILEARLQEESPRIAQLCGEVAALQAKVQDGSPASAQDANQDELTKKMVGSTSRAQATNNVAPPSPHLNTGSASLARPQDKRTLRDADSLDHFPWEPFFMYSIFGLVFVIVLPFALQLSYDFHIIAKRCHNTEYLGEFRRKDNETEPQRMPTWFLCYPTISFPPCGLIASTGIACVAAAVLLFFCSGDEVDQYLSVSSTPKIFKWVAMRCSKRGRQLVFMFAFALLPLVAWGGPWYWQVAVSRMYDQCSLVCTLEDGQKGEDAEFRDLCKANKMVMDLEIEREEIPSVWDPHNTEVLRDSDSKSPTFKTTTSDGRWVLETPWKSTKDTCAQMLKADHSNITQWLQDHEQNYYAFESLLLQTIEVGVLEISGPPCGVAWLIMMIASRLALRRKLASLNMAKRVFLKQKLANNSMEYIWLFIHMYYIQGMSFKKIRRQWVVQNLKEADPAWQFEDVTMTEWLQIDTKGASSTASTGHKDLLRQPRKGDKVQVAYRAFWKWEEDPEPAEDGEDLQRLAFTVGRKDDEVIEVFHMGVQKMRMCDTFTFTIDVEKACIEKVGKALVGFDPHEAPIGCTALVYEVTLCSGTPKQEDDGDMDGLVESRKKGDDDGDCLVDVDLESWGCSLHPDLRPAFWSLCFALGFSLIPCVVRHWKGHPAESFGRLCFFNTVVVFVTNGLVYFGFVRAYFAFQGKLQTLFAFDSMWQFPYEHPLQTMEDSDGHPLLHHAEGWLKVLDEVEAVDKAEGDSPRRLSAEAMAVRNRKGWEKKKNTFFDYNGYRASFTPKNIEVEKVFKEHLQRLDEWFNMRRYLQIDAYDERVSLELAMVVIFISFVPEVIVVLCNFTVFPPKKSLVQSVNFLALWNLIFSFAVVFGYLTDIVSTELAFEASLAEQGQVCQEVSLQFNNIYRGHRKKLESLKSHVMLQMAKQKLQESRECPSCGRPPTSRSASSTTASSSTPSPPPEEQSREVAVDGSPKTGPESSLEQDVDLINQYLESMTDSFSLFLGFKVDRRVVNGYMFSAVVTMLTQVGAIVKGILAEGDSFDLWSHITIFSPGGGGKED